MSSSIELIKRLHDERLRAVDAAKAIQFDVEARGGKWTAEDEAAWKKANDDIDELNKRVQSLTDIEERNRETEAQRAKFEKMIQPSNFAPHADSDEERLRAFVRASLPDSDAWAPRGITFSLKGVEKRDLLKTGGAGGTVPTGFVERLYQYLVEAAAVREISATLNTDSGENLTVPRATAHGGAALVAEAAAIAESDSTFSTVTLNAYKYGQLIQVSTEMAQDTGVDLIGYIAESGGRNLGLASGTHLVTGTGTGQPEGVMTNITAGVTLATGNTAGFTTSNSIDAVFDLFHSINSPYRRNGTWLTNDATVAKIRKLKDGQGNYLWQPGIVAGQPDTILGRPVVTDPNVATFAANAKVMAFGDFSQYYTVRNVNGVRFERSDDYAFANDLITFRVLLRTDGKVIVADAVKSLVASAT